MVTNQIQLLSENDVMRGISPSEEAVLFNASVRALGQYGFSEFAFDIGGKKSRRRYVKAKSSTGEMVSIWIKSAFLWKDMAYVLRFPWSKKSISNDDVQAVLIAADVAIRNGCTHMLATIGISATGKLEVARLYTLEQIKNIATAQKAACNHPFYISHGAALVLRSLQDAFTNAEKIALAVGENVLAPQIKSEEKPRPSVVRSGRLYHRDNNVREAVLNIADGFCERCGQKGFLTKTGKYYLETHHVVGVAERGPDSIDNIIAICAHCHRQAHYAADRIKVESDFMEAIRGRGKKLKNSGTS